MGGGGKTTTMFVLAKELATKGHCVITTTTTKILEPSPLETEKLILNNDEDALLKELCQDINNYQHITVARRIISPSKLDGITPEMAVRIGEIERVSQIIIEADGAARHALKAPRETEPVIPQNTTMVIAIVGIEAFGKKLEEEIVFRAEIAAKILNQPLGSVISAASIAELITNPKGIAKGSPPNARIIPFINKVDLPKGLENARLVANAILAKNHPAIERVLLGQAQNPDPVIEVIHKEIA